MLSTTKRRTFISIIQPINFYIFSPPLAANKSTSSPSLLFPAFIFFSSFLPTFFFLQLSQLGRLHFFLLRFGRSSVLSSESSLSDSDSVSETSNFFFLWYIQQAFEDLRFKCSLSMTSLSQVTVNGGASRSSRGCVLFSETVIVSVWVVVIFYFYFFKMELSSGGVDCVGMVWRCGFGCWWGWRWCLC